MTPHVLRASIVAALLLALTATAAIAAGETPTLRTGVTDQADVLTTSEEREVQASLDELRANHDVQLFVAYVDTIGTQDVTDFTSSTAHANSLGGNDALILVAIEERADSMWVGDSLDEITDAEIDGILTDALEPKLVDGDFAGAMIDAADAVGDAMTVDVPAAPTPAAATPALTAAPGGGGTGGTGTGTGSGSSGGGLNLTPIIAFLLLAGGLFLVGRTMLLRRRQGTVRAATLDTLNSQANRGLLATDEALKDAANDVEFAAAQWGDAEVVPYRDAIRQANDELRAAFALRQRLDDAEPEKPPERDAMLREIIARCTMAGQLLDAQEQRFDQLRDLEAAAPAQLATLPPLVEALRARRAAAEAIATRLRSTYAASATASVNGNLEEAAKAIDAAATEATRGAEIVATRPSEGVVALRRSQEAMARATQLIEGVERLGAGLDEAATRLATELDAATRDVESARAAVSGLGATAQLPPPAAGVPAPADAAAALRAAEVALDEARRAAQATPQDPLAALQRAVAANAAADAIVAQVADVNAQATRRRQAAETAIATAQGHVTRATDFITTRRHGVGEQARTRAAEAEVRLGEARGQVATDPEGATAAANRATGLADEAYRLAAGQFGGWSTDTGPVAGPYRQGGDGGEIVGAVLGGIIGAVLSGAASSGRGHGSGWGGSPWGTSGGGSMTGGFGIPSGPSGGGGRSRGGGFSMPSGGGFGGGGGGGRVRGGRW